jgi:hypothetical protein
MSRYAFTQKHVTRIAAIKARQLPRQYQRKPASLPKRAVPLAQAAPAKE